LLTIICPYLDFLYNPGYFLSIACFCFISDFLTPLGDTWRCSSATAAGPLSGAGVAVPRRGGLGAVPNGDGLAVER
jgi:hypothetical protein